MFEVFREDVRTHGGDWSRQGVWVLAVYRLGCWRYGLRPALARKIFSLLYKICYKLVQILTGVELPCEARIGRRLRIDHFGDIIISGYASFGDDCILRNGVTVGLRHEAEPVAPRIGNRVSFGAGCKVLGPIAVGDDAIIGANAVVIKDVPPGHVAVGVPATCKPRKDLPAHSPRGTD